MKKDIRLANGELISVKINFYTLYLLGEYGLKKLQKDSQNEDKQIHAAGYLIYAILRSQNLKVDKEEAMMLVPMDDDTIYNLFKEFEERLMEFKKKENSKM